MPKLGSNPTIAINKADISNTDNYSKSNERLKTSGFSSLIKNIFSNFNSEDILLFLILFLLIEEGIDDDFLIIGMILLIITE